MAHYHEAPFVCRKMSDFGIPGGGLSAGSLKVLLSEKESDN